VFAAPTVNYVLKSQGEMDVSPAQTKFMELRLNSFLVCVFFLTRPIVMF